MKGKTTHVTVAAGSSYQLTGYKLVLYKKRHKALGLGHGPMFRYISTNENIASVSDSGLITGKNPGNCYIAVVAINGVRKILSITVQ